MWKVALPFLKKAAMGAAGMAGGLVLKKAVESPRLAELAGDIADGVGFRFNPLNLTDPFGMQEAAEERKAAEERRRAERDLKRARQDADRREKAARQAGDANEARAAQTARLEAELAFRDKLAQIQTANDKRYYDAVRSGDRTKAALAVANQERAKTAARLAQSEAQLRLLTAQKASEGSDVGKLTALLDLVNKVKAMTMTGADVPRFDSDKVNADLDRALSDTEAFIRYDAATPEGVEMAGALYDVEPVQVREV